MLCPVVGVRVLMLCPVVGVRVLQSEELRRQGMEGRGVGDTLTDFPVWVTVDTASPPCHLALSSDDLTLSVCVTRPSGVFALMFDTRVFARQVCTITGHFLFIPVNLFVIFNLSSLCFFVSNCSSPPGHA